MSFKLYGKMKQLLENSLDPARDPNTDQEHLRDLFLNSPQDYELSKKLVSNENSPEDLLHLISHRDREHQDLFWKNDATILFQLENPEEFNNAVAQRITKKNVEDLHPNSIIAGVKSNHLGAHALLADANNIPNEAIDHLGKNTPSIQVKLRIAQRKNVAPETLDHILKNGVTTEQNVPLESHVAGNIFKNPNASSETLQHAFDTKKYNGTNIYNLLLHKNVTSEMLHNIAQDKNHSEIHELLASHPDISPETLHVLAHSPNIDIRKRVANNSDTSKETLRMLTKDWHSGIKKAAENNLGAY